jgi:hypothetical protein
MPEPRRPLVYITVAPDREGVGATREVSIALASAGFDVFPGPAEQPFFPSSHSAEDHPSRDAFAAVVVISPGALESKETVEEVDALIRRASTDPSFRLCPMATESVSIGEVAQSALRPLAEFQFATGATLHERIAAVDMTLSQAAEPEPTLSTGEAPDGEALEAQAEVPLPSFSRAALRALGFAAEMVGGDADDPARLRTAALLGALRASAVSGMGPTTGDVVRLVLDRHTGRDALPTLAAAADAAGLKPVEDPEPEAMTVETLMASSVRRLVEDAIGDTPASGRRRRPPAPRSGDWRGPCRVGRRTSGARNHAERAARALAGVDRGSVAGRIERGVGRDPDRTAPSGRGRPPDTA